VESGLAYGLLGSAVTGTASVALRARYQAAELDLGALFGLPHYQPIGPGVLETSLVAGTALGCWWLGGENRLALGGCAGPALGSLQGSGHGYDHDGSARPLWFAAVFGLAARVPIRPRWTCRTRVSEAVDAGGNLQLEPLRNFTVVKDLAVEMVTFFDKWRDAKGHFEPGEPQADFQIVWHAASQAP